MSIKEEIQNFNSNIKENGVRQKRTPRNYDSILKGAIELSLEERVNLKKALHESITNEVEAAKLKAEQFAKIAQG